MLMIFCSQPMILTCWLRQNSYCLTILMKDLREASYVLGIQILPDIHSGILRLSQQTYIARILKRFNVTPPTQHTVSSEGVIFFNYKLITFKLVHSYKVKHLTCTILCNNGLQNIYKLHIWKCSTFTIFTLFTKTKHIQK